MNKKLIMALFVGLLALMLVACGSNEEGNGYTGDTDNDDSDTKEVEAESDEETDEEELDTDDTHQDGSLDLEIVDEKFSKFQHYGMMGIIGVYAEIKNNEDFSVAVTGSEIKLLDEDDKMLSVENMNDGDLTLNAPEMIEPNESTYISFTADYEDKYEDLDDVEVTTSGVPVDDDIPLEKLDVDNENFMYELEDDEDEQWEDAEDPTTNVTVTMELTNKSDQDLDYSLAVAFYDEDDNLIGSSIDTDYMDGDYFIEAGETRNIEVLESLPFEESDVDHTEIKAYGNEPSEDDMDEYFDEDEDW